MRVNQVPVVINVHCIPAVVILASLEVVSRSVVKTFSKASQNSTVKTRISVKQVMPSSNTIALKNVSTDVFTMFITLYCKEWHSSWSCKYTCSFNVWCTNQNLYIRDLLIGIILICTNNMYLCVNLQHQLMVSADKLCIWIPMSAPIAGNKEE